MTRPLLRTPRSHDLWASDEDSASPRSPDQGGTGAGDGGNGARPTSSGGRPPRRAPLAVLLVLSALLGGGVSAGVVAATGVLGNDAAQAT
ncbi:MAG: hypothetical protein QOJ89_1837, partial [bacterium]